MSICINVHPFVATFFAFAHAITFYIIIITATFWTIVSVKIISNIGNNCASATTTNNS